MKENNNINIIIDQQLPPADKSEKCTAYLAEMMKSNQTKEGFEDAMTVMVLPLKIRKKLRTSNHIERLNKELKRRSKVIDVFPNQESLIRLMGAVMLERNEANKLDRHQAFFKTEIKEVRQMTPILEQIAKEQQAALVA